MLLSAKSLPLVMTSVSTTPLIPVVHNADCRCVIHVYCVIMATTRQQICNHGAYRVTAACSFGVVFSERELRSYVFAHPSVVCLSSDCNVCAPYSTG